MTKKHGFKDFDLAYAYECLSRAHVTSGNKLECKNLYEKEKQYGILISDSKIFLGDLKEELWFDCLH